MAILVVCALFAIIFIIQDMAEVTTLRRRAQARNQKARSMRVNTSTADDDGLLNRAGEFVAQARARTAARKAADRLIQRGEELAAKAEPVPTPMWEVEKRNLSRLEREVHAYTWYLACQQAADRAALRVMGVMGEHPLVVRGEELAAKAEPVPTPMREVEQALRAGANLWARLLNGEVVTTQEAVANSALAALEAHGYTVHTSWAGDGLVDVAIIN